MHNLQLPEIQASSHGRMGGIHRRYNRADIVGFNVNIADGNRVIGGIVDDVSSNGFRMSQGTDAFATDKHVYSAVVSGEGKHFKLIAKPCWSRESEKGVEIGFKIVDSTWDWLEFILAKVPENA